MISKEFAYSAQAHYAHSSAFKVKTVNIINQNIVVTSDGKSFQVSLGGYNLQTKPCRPVDHGPVRSGPKGDILQTKYLADQILCRVYSE